MHGNISKSKGDPLKHNMKFSCSQVEIIIDMKMSIGERSANKDSLVHSFNSKLWLFSCYKGRVE
jgi:hypothetical protein